MEEPKEPAVEEAADATAGSSVSERSESASISVHPRNQRHYWLVRLTHWSAFVLIFGMVASGLQIYGAYARFGTRGGSPFPNPFQDAQLPRWMRLGGWLAGGLNWHFFLMWPLIIVGVSYVGYLLVSGEWKKLVFRPRDVKPAVAMTRYYLRLDQEHPAQGKHNALQKQAYTGVILLGALSVLTGFAIWKPVQLSWLTALFGGYQLARYWHFWVVWLFVGFSVVHILAVFVVDPASLRGMVTGWYRGRYQSDEP